MEVERDEFQPHPSSDLSSVFSSTNIAQNLRIVENGITGLGHELLRSMDPVTKSFLQLTRLCLGHVQFDSPSCWAVLLCRSFLPLSLHIEPRTPHSPFHTELLAICSEILAKICEWDASLYSKILQDVRDITDYFGEEIMNGDNFSSGFVYEGMNSTMPFVAPSYTEIASTASETLPALSAFIEFDVSSIDQLLSSTLFLVDLQLACFRAVHKKNVSPFYARNMQPHIHHNQSEGDAEREQEREVDDETLTLRPALHMMTLLPTLFRCYAAAQKDETSTEFEDALQQNKEIIAFTIQSSTQLLRSSLHSSPSPLLLSMSPYAIQSFLTVLLNQLKWQSSWLLYRDASTDDATADIISSLLAHFSSLSSSKSLFSTNLPFWNQILELVSWNLSPTSACSKSLKATLVRIVSLFFPSLPLSARKDDESSILQQKRLHLIFSSAIDDPNTCPYAIQGIIQSCSPSASASLSSAAAIFISEVQRQSSALVSDFKSTVISRPQSRQASQQLQQQQLQLQAQQRPSPEALKKLLVKSCSLSRILIAMPAPASSQQPAASITHSETLEIARECFSLLLASPASAPSLSSAASRFPLDADAALFFLSTLSKCLPSSSELTAADVKLLSDWISFLFTNHRLQLWETLLPAFKLLSQRSSSQAPTHLRLWKSGLQLHQIAAASCFPLIRDTIRSLPAIAPYLTNPADWTAILSQLSEIISSPTSSSVTLESATLLQAAGASSSSSSGSVAPVSLASFGSLASSSSGKEKEKDELVDNRSLAYWITSVLGPLAEICSKLSTAKTPSSASGQKEKSFSVPLGSWRDFFRLSSTSFSTEIRCVFVGTAAPRILALFQTVNDISTHLLNNDPMYLQRSIFDCLSSDDHRVLRMALVSSLPLYIGSSSPLSPSPSVVLAHLYSMNQHIKKKDAEKLAKKKKSGVVEPPVEEREPEGPKDVMFIVELLSNYCKSLSSKPIVDAADHSETLVAAASVVAPLFPEPLRNDVLGLIFALMSREDQMPFVKAACLTSLRSIFSSFFKDDPSEYLRKHADTVYPQLILRCYECPEALDMIAIKFLDLDNGAQLIVETVQYWIPYLAMNPSMKGKATYERIQELVGHAASDQLQRQIDFVHPKLFEFIHPPRGFFSDEAGAASSSSAAPAQVTFRSSTLSEAQQKEFIKASAASITSAYSFLAQITGFGLETLSEWATDPLLNAFLWKLGDESIAVQQHGLYCLCVWAELRPNERKPSDHFSLEVHVERLLKTAFLARMDFLGRMMVEPSLETRQHSLRSLSELIRRVHKSCKSYAPKILSALKSALTDPGLRPQALDAWFDLVQALHKSLANRKYLGQFVVDLLPCLDTDTAKVVTILDFLFVTNQTSYKDSFKEVPFLPNVPALKKVNDAIGKDQTLTPREKLNRLINLVESNSMNVRGVSLEYLRNLVLDDPHARSIIFRDVTENNSAFVSRLLSRVLKSSTVISAPSDQYQIAILAAEVLGAIGAIDPSSVKVDLSTEMRPDLTDYQMSTTIIETYLYPMLKGGSEKIHDRVAYAIQMFLQLCQEMDDLNDAKSSRGRGSDDEDDEDDVDAESEDDESEDAEDEAGSNSDSDVEMVTPKAKKQDKGKASKGKEQKKKKKPKFKAPTAISATQGAQSLNGRPWWDEMSEDVKQGIAPFVHSLYVATSKPSKQIPSPVFRSNIPLRQWLKQWSFSLIARSTEKKKIFEACQSVMKEDIGLALFVLPQIVSHVVMDGSDEDHASICTEMLAVLSHAAPSEHAQTVFGMVDRLTSLVERYKLMRPSAEYKRKYERIFRFLSTIPKDMLARSSMINHAHSRALRYFEEHIRFKYRRRKPALFVGQFSGLVGALEAEETAFLRQVYLELEDSDAIIGIGSLAKVDAPSTEQYVVELESSGRWTEALGSYEAALMSNPDSIQLFKSIFKCYKNLGMMQTAFSFIDTHRRRLAADPARNELQALESEAAWRLSKWDSLDELIASSSSSSSVPSVAASSSAVAVDVAPNRIPPSTVASFAFQAHLSSALLGVNRKIAEPELLRSLSSARRAALQSLAAAAMDSYPRCYPPIVQLQMLNDIQAFYNCLTPSPASSSSSSSASALTPASITEPERVKIAALANDQWRKTLDLMQPSVSARDPVLALRRALLGMAKLNNEIRDNWLQSARLARNAGSFQAASTYIFHAKQVADGPQVAIQRAKLMRQQSPVQELVHAATFLESAAAEYRASPSKATPAQLAKIMLMALTYRLESGSAGHVNLTSQFEQVIRIQPHWESGHFRLAKYLDTLLESQIGPPVSTLKSPAANGDARSGSSKDMTTSDAPRIAARIREDLPNVLSSYAQSLRYGSKHLFESLPRLITLWLNWTSALTHASNLPLSGKAPSSSSGRGGVSSAGRSGPSNPIIDAIESINATVSAMLPDMPSSLWLNCVAYLMSCVAHRNAEVVSLIKTITSRILMDHPHQAAYPIFCVVSSTSQARKAPAESIVRMASEQMARDSTSTNPQVRRKAEIVHKVITDMATFFDCMLKLSAWDAANLGKRDNQNKMIPHQHLSLVDGGRLSLKIKELAIVMPLSSFMVGSGPVIPCPDQPPESQALITVSRIGPSFDVLSSLQKPRKIALYGNNGAKYDFLVKPGDDMRKDARMMEVNSVLNKLLVKDQHTRRRGLYLRTFSVVPLNEINGFVEWVPNTTVLRDVISKQNKIEGQVMSSTELKATMDQGGGQTDWKQRRINFETGIMPRFRPMLHKWFIGHFADPTKWLQARSNFTRTAAVWSMVGFITGLGDRHGENILMDIGSGDCLHVDFSALFDKGRTLEVPECVPFRLTPCMVDAMGLQGVEGLFRRCCEATMTLLRQRRDMIRIYLETFVHDPLHEWANASRSATLPDGSRAPSKKDVVEVLADIENKLRGVVHPQTPAFPKDTHTAAAVSGPLIVGVPSPATEHPVSVEAQVNTLILQATNTHLLSQMYIWWMPWL